MAKYRYTGDEPRVFVDIPDPAGNGTWVAKPGDTIDLDLEPETVTVENEDGTTSTAVRSPIDWLEPVAKPKTVKSTSPTESKE